MKGKFLSVIILAMLLTFAGATAAKAQTVWMVCSFDTSSIIPQAGKQDKFERRFYVTDPISTSKKAFLDADRNPGRIEGSCGDYFEKTVFKAATDRGEKIDTGGTLKVIRNIDHTDDGIGYKYATKEEIEKIRADAIKEAEDADRVIFNFNWDPSGKNEATDLQNEVKRTAPTLSGNEKKPN